MALVVIIDDGVTDVDAYAGRLRSSGSGDGHPVPRRSSARRSRCERASLRLVDRARVDRPRVLRARDVRHVLPADRDTYVLAVAPSMLIALLVTPAVGMIVMSRGPERGESRTGARSAPGSSGGSVFSGGPCRSRRRLACWGVGVVSLPSRRADDRPTFKETNLRDPVGAPSTSLAEMQRGSPVPTNSARSPASPASARTSGGPWCPTRRSAQHRADLGRTGPEADDEAWTRRSNAVAGYPGETTEVVTYSNARIDEVLPDPGAPVAVRLFGEDRACCRPRQEGASRDAGVDGVGEPRSVPINEPTLEIEVDLDRAERARGRKPGDVRRAAATLLSGISVGRLFEEQKVFEVVVWGDRRSARTRRTWTTS